MPHSGEVRSLVEIHGVKSTTGAKEDRQNSPALGLFLCFLSLPSQEAPSLCIPPKPLCPL